MKIPFLDYNIIRSNKTDDIERRLNTHIDGHEDLRDEVNYLREEMDELKTKMANIITLVTKG